MPLSKVTSHQNLASGQKDDWSFHSLTVAKDAVSPDVQTLQRGVLFLFSGKGRKFCQQHNVSPLQANSEDLAQVQQCIEQKTCVVPQETILNDSCVSFSHLYFIQQSFAEQARSLCITCLVKITFVYCCVGGLSILLKGTPDSQCW